MATMAGDQLVGMFGVTLNRTDAHGHDLAVALQAQLERGEILVRILKAQRMAIRLGAATDALRVGREDDKAIAPFALQLLDPGGKALRHLVADLADEGAHRPRTDAFAAGRALL